MLTLFTLNWLHSLAFPLHVSTQHLNIKENALTTTTTFLLSQTRPFRTSLLLFGTIPGKVPCFITAETYYFWQVSRFPYNYIASLGTRLPFWATVEVVPWLLAPETGDMTQVLPGIQSTSLPEIFRSNQGFYLLGSYSTSSVGNATRSPFGQFWEMCPSSPHE